MEMTFSNFLRTPTEGLSALDEGDEVILIRRDGANLRVRRDVDDVVATTSLQLASRVIGRLTDQVTPALSMALRAEFPWVAVLSTDEVNAFEAEFLEALLISASLGNLTKLQTVVNAWQETAELKTDPVRKSGIEQRLKDEVAIAIPHPEFASVASES